MEKELKMENLTIYAKNITILTGDEELDKHLEIGADPHGAMCTGTGHSRADVKHDPSAPKPKMKLTQEEQDIYDGKKGEVLSKVMKTVIAYGEAFGASKLVDLGGNPHTVLLGGTPAVTPVIDILNECADAGLKTYAEYTINPRPYDFYNVEVDPEHQLKLQSMFSTQTELEKMHVRLGAKNYNYWSCACYWPEVGNAPAHGTNLAWSESSAVNYANSVLGARSNRNSGGIEMLCNILGKAPYFGLMTDEGRKAKWLIEVKTKGEPNWSVLGGAIGMKVMEDVPYIVGIDKYLGQVDGISMGKLKDMGAATATNGAVGLYHVENITPDAIDEGRKLLAKDYKTYVIDDEIIEQVRKHYPNLWTQKDAKPTRAFVGCPHNSFHQLYDWGMKVTHELSNRGQERVAIPLHLLCSTLVKDHFMDKHPELVRDMIRAGITFTNSCPLTFLGIPGITKTEFAVTNSNKAREYTNSRFFRDEDILEIVLSGEIPEEAV
ncbi:aconitase X [Lutimonas vermicola]|uniref:Aconitase X n=1 Tax=Lutimonas vermicola TaxID=414288 RepID=A0ABU9L2E3_9FLAO